MALQLSGFERLVSLGQSAGSSLWRAARTRDGAAVLLKVLEGIPTEARRVAFRREFSLLTSLDAPGIVRPLDYLPGLGSPVIVLAPFAGQPLELECRHTVPDSMFCLQVACGLAGALEVLHAAGLVHHDIRPLNVLTMADGEIRLSDCSRAAVEGEGSFSAEDMREGEVDWAYLSPEMTGRMNRKVDHRTDLYSLGVVFFRIVTGRLPFQARDPLEWTHAHLALQPRAPAAVSPSVPRVLSDIVMRLLAKQPEERYQTARGLRMDLERCLAEVRGGGAASPFPLATHDVPLRLNFSGRLYGRETELTRLMAGFQKVADTGNSEFLLISGQAGAGKSALVQELQEQLGRQGVAVVTGRFEQLRQDIPYATLGLAFQESIRAILSGSEEELEDWRQKLQSALGPDGQVLVEVIPRLALILGPQPPLADISQADAPKRFNRIFRRLLTVFATKDHPMVLFLDDLQWADAASLHLLESLVAEPDVQFLLLIGAYRNSGTTPSHALQNMLERLGRRQALIEEISLGPLSQDAVGRLLMDLLGRSTDQDVERLAALVLRKTAGNPFFILQFVAMLHRESLIAFDRGSSCWRWDVAELEGQGLTNNVLDLLAGMMARLPTETVNLIKVMACIGNSVEIPILERVWDGPMESIPSLLGHAVREGLLLRSGNTLRFLHDRVREAADALVSDAHRADEHLRLGRLLNLAWSSAEQQQEHVFEIVSQFNRGASLLTDTGEKFEVARLNLLAGKKAKTSAAYAAASSYLAAGTAVLPATAWESEYELTFSLNLHWGECAYLSGDLEGAKTQLMELLGKARTKAEQASVYRVLISTFLTSGERDTAWNLLLAGLAQYGMVLPSQPTREDVLSEYGKLMSSLGGTEIEELLQRPPMEDPDMRAAMELLALLPMPQMTKDPKLAFLACARIILLSLLQGNTAASAKGYSMFGVEMLGFVSDYRMAHRFAKLGHDLAQKADYVSQLPATGLALGAVSFWTRPLAETAAIAASTQEVSLKFDDLNIACVAGHYLVILKLLEGCSLMETLQVLHRQLVLIKKANNRRISESLQNVERRVLKLMRTPAAESTVADRSHGEKEESGKAADHGDVISDIYLLMVDCILGDHVAALEASDRALTGIAFRVGKADYFAFQLYRGLASAAVYAEAPADRKPALRQAIEASHGELEVWAESCPANFRAAFCLVSAERARIEARTSEAARLYEEALASAREGGFISYAALAHELASRFYRSQGLDRIADAELRGARACYARWGAMGKVGRLDAAFPSLIGPGRGLAEQELGEELEGSAAPAGQKLDFLAVLKASQAVSGEIVLDRLLAILMRVVLESSGAQGGFLVLVRQQALHLAAEATVVGSEVTVKVHGDDAMHWEAASSTLLPQSLLNYVQRTGEKVLLGDATVARPIVADPYLARRRPKSVLCFPILRRSGPIALVYLDNVLVSNTFTPDRLATLELLASQAAISLENAILYKNLQRENAERKRAEDELRGSQQLLQNIIDSSSAVIYVKDLNGAFILVNRVFARIFKVTSGAVIGRTDHDIFPPKRADVLRARDRMVLETGTSIASEDLLDHEDGVHTYVSVKNPLFDQVGRIFAVCCIATDISESKQVEEQLRQAQKMEAVGQLAGGIAHDFNNLLTAINGYCWLALREVGEQDPTHEYLDEIKRAGDRAAALTRQLLAYSRKQVLEPKIWDLNLIVADMEKMLRRLISEDIILTTCLRPEAGRVKVDRGQVEQMLVNLVVTARDAMPGGGRLTVETMRIDAADIGGASRLGTSAAGRVLLEVRDTGTGMTPEVQSQIFEPYFTTKAAGRGTGLGLSVVYGIVKQSGGSLNFQSEPGKGTTFRIYFPEAPEADDDAGQHLHRIAADQRRGTGHILLVEDDDSVRTFVSKVLEEQGYTVLSASNGREAMTILEQSGAQIQLVITDVIMPEMGGIALSNSLKQLFPSMPLLFVSGYTESPARNLLGDAGGRAFLQKPFRPAVLLEKVQRLLDGTAGKEAVFPP